MPDIHPFRAFQFGPAHTRRIDRLVCPPYDVISPDGRDALLAQDPDNFVCVEQPVGPPRQRYREAARQWDRWLSSGLIVRARSPSYYVYEARFPSQRDGQPLVRRGFFAAVRVTPWGQGVHPHEKTLPTARADRYELFKALGVQTSPIQLLAKDDTGRMARLIRAGTQGPPWARFKDADGVTHRLWPWSDARSARELESLMAQSPCAVADGHHRYETALAYARRARQRGDASPAGQHVLAYISSSDDPGLEVLSTHRAIPWTKRRWVKWAGWGRLTPVKSLADLKNLWLGRQTHTAPSVGVFHRGRFGLFAFDRIPPVLKNTPSQHLAVACLHEGPLRGLGKEDFFFTRDPQEAVARAREEKGWAVFPPPATVNDILHVAVAGQVMPPKSTYFYPKIPSGLVSHALGGPL